MSNSIQKEQSVSLLHNLPNTEEVEHIKFSRSENGIDVSAFKSDKYNEETYSFYSAITFEQFQEFVTNLLAIMPSIQDKPTMPPSESRQS